MSPMALVCVSTDLTWLRFGLGKTVLASPTPTIWPLAMLRSSICAWAWATPPFAVAMSAADNK